MQSLRNFITSENFHGSGTSKLREDARLLGWHHRVLLA